MEANDYEVTFGYGEKDGVYYGPNGSLGEYHRGDDRAMPKYTPVPVNGHLIGLSGDGNGRYGAHLHTGKFFRGQDINPRGGGFELDGAIVVGVLKDFSDPVNGKYVRIQDAYGYIWVYLHLDEVFVNVGDKLDKKEDFSMEDKQRLAVAILDSFFGRFAERKVKDSELAEYTRHFVTGDPDKFFEKAANFDEVVKVMARKVGVADGQVKNLVKDLQAVVDKYKS